MNIAIIGYGRMGREIEILAKERGHTISCIIEAGEIEKFSSSEFQNSDIAIEFTTPETAVDNYKKCFQYNIPVVSGTTGWLEHLEEIKRICEQENQTLFYASNFSLGVNIFFAINRYLARIMSKFSDYDVQIEETHHIHKLDAPSGTAITLANDIISESNQKSDWRLQLKEKGSDLVIHSIRRDEVPGTHEIFYESEADIISIKHEAKNRKGFAVGAVLAAEFTFGKKGFLGMMDMLDF